MKDWGKDDDRFLDAPQVEYDQCDDKERNEGHLVLVKVGRQEAEEGISRRMPEHRDRQHVINQQAAPEITPALSPIVCVATI
jgi:hypothetical protein